MYDHTGFPVVFSHHNATGGARRHRGGGYGAVQMGNLTAFTASVQEGNTLMLNDLFCLFLSLEFAALGSFCFLFLFLLSVNLLLIFGFL